MRDRYIAAMDKLYMACVVVCCVSIVVMTVLIAIGVFSRYVLHIGAFYSEPISIFLAVQLTFFGAAACYRADVHLRLEIVENAAPEVVGRWLRRVIDLLMAGVSIFMVVFGVNLVEATLYQSYPEFQFIRVGVVYSAIPIGGFVTLLFVIEKFLTNTQLHRRALYDVEAEEADAPGRTI